MKPNTDSEYIYVLYFYTKINECCSNIWKLLNISIYTKRTLEVLVLKVYT